MSENAKLKAIKYARLPDSQSVCAMMHQHWDAEVGISLWIAKSVVKQHTGWVNKAPIKDDQGSD